MKAQDLLQYQIENVRIQTFPQFVVEAHGWLIDLGGAPTGIDIVKPSGATVTFNVTRFDRPDVGRCFGKAVSAGFDLWLSGEVSDGVRIVFRNGRDEVSFAAASLSAIGSVPPDKYLRRMKLDKLRRRCVAAVKSLLTSPVRLLKRFKNMLFRISPSFQNFYMKHVYFALHPAQAVAASGCVANSPWGEHIILVSHFADGTGAPLLALNIARELHGFGFNLHIVLLRDGELRERFRQYGSVNVLTSRKGLETLLEEWKPFGIRRAFLNTAISGACAEILKEHGIFTVTLIHEMIDTLTVMGYGGRVDAIVRCSDRIVIPSSLISGDWAGQKKPLPEDRTVVMPQPDYHSTLVPIEDPEERRRKYLELRRELKIPDDALIVMGCGSLEERKAPDVFFRVAAKAAKLDPKVYFVWIGDYGAPYYRKKLDSIISAASDNILLLPYSVLDPYYYGADIFFLPSKSDPFPTVALLAAKVALPVVFCRESTGIRDLFGGIDGCSIEKYSEKEFMPLLQRLLEDREFRESRGALCRRAYREKMYDFRTYVRKLYELSGGTPPKVTAVIPNYNYAAFLSARLESVAAQTFPVHEVLILDDCSTDDSAEVIKGLLKKYEDVFPGGIRFLPNRENAGVFRQWMRGVENASGELIWIAEADDSCSPEMLSRLVPAFMHDDRVQLAYAQSKLMDSDGKVYLENFSAHTGAISTIKWSRDYIADGASEIETALAIKNSVPNASAALIRKEAFRKIPDELFSYRVIGDWFAYLHIVRNGRIAFCAEPLNLYRRHRNSVVAKNIEVLLAELLRLNAYVAKNFPISDHTIGEMRKEYARNCEFLNHADDSGDLFGRFGGGGKKKVKILVPGTPPDLAALKRVLEKADADFAFVCFEDSGAVLPPEVSDAFGGVVHVFWKDELHTPLTVAEFRPLPEFEEGQFDEEAVS